MACAGFKQKTSLIVMREKTVVAQYPRSADTRGSPMVEGFTSDKFIE